MRAYAYRGILFLMTCFCNSMWRTFEMQWSGDSQAALPGVYLLDPLPVRFRLRPSALSLGAAFVSDVPQSDGKMRRAALSAREASRTSSSMRNGLRAPSVSSSGAV